MINMNCPPTARKQGRRCFQPLVALLLTLHAALLAWGAWRHSPTWDEIAYLPAGISHWELGRFDLYRINPPLIRLVAAVPVGLARPRTDWSNYTTDHRVTNRAVGRDFIIANGERSFLYFGLARLACVPLSVMGGYFCYRWARDLYGPLPGIFALTLWCLSPNILGHAQLTTTDAGAAAFGITAGYLFWRWLREPNGPRMLAAGVGLGLVALTKTNWIILFALWPTLWLVWSGPSLRTLVRRAGLRQAAQVLTILLVGLYIINMGYGFEGSFKKLGDYQFASKTLSGHTTNGMGSRSFGNRFADTWLGDVPVPLPRNYVRGVDMVQIVLESPRWSYLGGEWREGGWWYYYLYALAIKVPLGTWCLLLGSLVISCCFAALSSSWRDEVVLLAPLVVILVAVSRQTALSHHMRWMLPIFPFAFVWASKIAQPARLRNRTVAWIAGLALCWSVGSSLWVYPHSLSYFNELVGGPTGGHAHLHDSNIDWGQDLLYLRRWLDDHPEARPLGLACFVPRGLLDPRVAGIEYTLPPPGREARLHAPPGSQGTFGPQPGWYAVSVCHMHGGPWKDHAYFLHFKPVAMAGYSIYIYRISLEEANSVRRKLGLPELPHGSNSIKSPHAIPDGSNELDSVGGEHRHLEENQTVPPALNIGCSVDSLTIAYRQVGDFEVELRRPKEQVEISERVEISEVRPVPSDQLIVAPPEHFGATQGVFDRLAQEPGECHTEELVADDI